MKQWLHDGLLRKLFKNGRILFSGSVASSIIGLVSLAITARALGVEQFGYLVLITTYVLIVDKLVNFQSWQAIIKYGANALEQNKKNDFKSLLKFGFILDIGTAVLGTLLAASAVWFIGSWIGWKDEHKLMAATYSVTILFHISGTPIAILRLCDQFKKTAIQQVYASAFKIIGVSVAFIFDAGLWGFLIVWALIDILGKVLLIYYAHKELIARKIFHIFSSSIANLSERFNSVWGFIWTTNLHASVKIGLREFDILIVGVLLGPSASGTYKIVKSIGTTVGQISDPFYQAIYPDLIRSFLLKNFTTFRRLIIMPATVLAAISFFSILAFYFFGEQVVNVLLGRGYEGVFSPAMIYLLRVFLSIITFGFHPALLAMGKAKSSFYILVISMALYILVLYNLTIIFGLIGAALSYVFFYVAWSTLQLITISYVIRRES